MKDLINQQLGPYQLRAVIRHGGMATIYQAYQPSLDRMVAVKVMPPNREGQFATRFKREARAVAQLQHPNIVPVYDYGEQDGLFYIAMQYIDGGAALGDQLGAPMDPPRALALLSYVLAGVGYAHTRGVVHRDIKPANILLANPSWPMLTDFGIAKLIDEDEKLTSVGVAIGTPAYMSPEQAEGQLVDGRSDLYSLGVVLYEMFTGRVPFNAPTPLSVLRQHLFEPPPPPRSLNPQLSPELEALLLRALAKDPNQRFASAEQMAAAFEQVSTTPAPAPNDELVALYAAGLQALESGNWDSAVAQLSRLAERDPSYGNSASLLAAARQGQQRARSRATSAQPGTVSTYARGLLQRGEQKELAGDLHGALVDYRAAQAVAPPGQLYDGIEAIIAHVLVKLEPAATAQPAAAAPFETLFVADDALPAAPERVQAEPRRQPRWALLLLALVVLGGIGGAFALRGRLFASPAALPVIPVAASATPSATATYTATATGTPTALPSATATVTPTSTPSATATFTPLPSATPSVPPTATSLPPSATPVVVPTVRPTRRPPTATIPPPTDTPPPPTDTPPPPTDTPPPPTDTPLPPTATPESGGGNDDDGDDDPPTRAKN